MNSAPPSGQNHVKGPGRSARLGPTSSEGEPMTTTAMPPVVDEATWRRGRGWAPRQAVVALPYDGDTHPGTVRQASRAVAHLLVEPL